MGKVMVDDREPKKMLKLMSLAGLDWERKRMVTGDYICGDVCIERKSIDDMCGSIVDGRLKTQVERMKKGFKWNYVLISGKIGDRKSEVHENCILGKIVSLIIKDGVNVICVDNDKQLVYVMKRIFERHKDVLD
jgi:ERCC4-type nuclease